VNGFYWAVPRVLAGSGRPGGRPGTSGEADRLAADLAWLRGQGIGAILTLTETPLDLAQISELDISYLHLPVIDMTPPTPLQLMDALAFIDHHTAQNRPVLVHCLVGQGRTGTVLAAHKIRAGCAPEQAIAEIRLVCPHAVENERQEEALRQFARRRDWLI
jgi:atypical dual specificity phosphatase